MITLSINSDRIAEGDELFLLQLKTPPSPSVLGVPSSAIITIIDDDGKIICDIELNRAQLKSGHNFPLAVSQSLVTLDPF